MKKDCMPVWLWQMGWSFSHHLFLRFPTKYPWARDYGAYKFEKRRERERKREINKQFHFGLHLTKSDRLNK